MSEKTIRVRKLAVARRQFHTAIELWFGDGDPISVHTLAAAAYQVICDLLRHRGLPEHLFDNPRIRPEKRQLWIRAVRANASFFKHADQDPELEQEFNPQMNAFYLVMPQMNAFYLVMCLAGLQDLGVTFDDVEAAFWRAMVESW